MALFFILGGCHDLPFFFSFLISFILIHLFVPLDPLYCNPFPYGLISLHLLHLYPIQLYPTITSLADALPPPIVLHLSSLLMDSQASLLSPFIHTLPCCTGDTYPHVVLYINCNTPKG